MVCTISSRAEYKRRRRDVEIRGKPDDVRLADAALFAGFISAMHSDKFV
jgi:hypothetical protein